MSEQPIHPTIDPTAFVAESAIIRGDVRVGPRASIWFGVIRPTSKGGKQDEGFC